MKGKKEKLIRILRIELEDLEDDIALLEETAEERREKHEITNYVLLENLALLKKESGCIQVLMDSIETLELDRYGSLEDAAAGLKEHFREMARENGFPGAVYRLVDRKIDKVVQYVQA